MKIYFYKYTREIFKKSKVLEFQRFQGFWTSTVSMDFSWLYASSLWLLYVGMYEFTPRVAISGFQGLRFYWIFIATVWQL